MPERPANHTFTAVVSVFRVQYVETPVMTVMTEETVYTSASSAANRNGFFASLACSHATMMFRPGALQVT